MNAQAREIPTTAELLEMVRALIQKEKGPDVTISDYAVAKRLGWSPQRIYRLLDGTHTLDENGCLDVAAAIGWPAETVLACIYLERAKKQNKDSLAAALERLCHRVAISVSPVFIGFIAGFLALH